jgi:anti-sigma factor (TIGR02949 family)
MTRPHCERCEELLQLYVDGELDEGDAHTAEAHLDRCGYCRSRYRLERRFRAVLRQFAAEPISDELRQRLSSLRLMPR